MYVRPHLAIRANKDHTPSRINFQAAEAADGRPAKNDC